MNILNNKYVSDYLEKNSDLVNIIKSYLNILNDKKYSLEAKGGNIDVSLNSNEYIFNLEQLIFAGEIPATENTPEIKSEYTINGKLKLQGRNLSLSKNVYNNITVDFDVNSIFKFQDSISSSNYQISSDKLHLDLNGEFEIKDDELGRPTIKSDLNEIQVVINNDIYSGNSKYDFRFDLLHPGKESLRINEKLAYELTYDESGKNAFLKISGDFYNFYELSIIKTLNVLDGKIFDISDKKLFSFKASTELKNNDINLNYEIFGTKDFISLEKVLLGLLNNDVENIQINLIPGTEINTYSFDKNYESEINGLSLNLNEFVFSFVDNNGIKWKFEEINNNNESYIQIHKFEDSNLKKIAVITKETDKYIINFTSDLNSFSYKEFLENKTITLLDKEDIKIKAFANKKGDNLNPLIYFISKDISETIDLKNQLSSILSVKNIDLIASINDQTAPDAPTITTSSSITNDNTPLITGVAEAGSTVKLYSDSIFLGSGTADSNGAFSITSSTLSDGLYSLKATATDAAGNISDPSSPLNITIDTSAPDAPTITTSSLITNDSTPLITGVAEAGCTITLYSDSKVLGSAVADENNKFSILTYNFRIDINGAISHYKYYGKSEGRSLNSFSPSRYLKKYSDLKAVFGNDETSALKHYIEYGFKEGRTDSSTGSGGSSNLTDFQALNYIASNNDLISAFGVDIEAAKSHYKNYGKVEGRSLNSFSPSRYLEKYSDLKAVFGDDETSALKHYIQFGFKEGRSDSSTGSGGSYNLTDFQALNYIASHSDLIIAFSSSTLDDGNYSLKAIATDAAGNTSDLSSPLNITIDTVIPIAPSFPFSNTSSSITNDSTPKITGSSESGSSVKIYNNSILLGSAVTGSDEVFSIISSNLNDGDYLLQATATDAAGNISDPSSPLNITIDTSAPDAPTITTSSLITNDNTPLITGAAEAGSTVKLYSDSTVLGSATADSNGAFSITSSTLSDGIYLLKATATDAAGNASSLSRALAIRVNKNLKFLSESMALNYIASNNDLISAFGLDIEAAKSHYMNYGESEGRSLTSFSPTRYLEKYSDLKAVFGDDETSALKHYIQFGFKEGRTDSDSDSGLGSKSSSDLTDLEAYNYIASNNDLISVFGTDIEAAKAHYTDYGKAEGRPLDNFDEWGYLASNNDLMNHFKSDATKAIKHYISYGKSEGRVTNLFNAETYLNNYPDLKNAFGNDLDAAKKHFVEYGFNEGRTI